MTSDLADSKPTDPEAVTARTWQQLRDAALAAPADPQPMISTRVTAVVLTRNKPELLQRTLDSLCTSDAPPRVIVIDNDSEPEAARQVEAACTAHRGVQLQRLETNVGCAGGRRLGVRSADTELVLFLDDDAELLPGALEHLLRELDTHPSAGAVTATVVTPDGTVHHSGGALEADGEVATFDLIAGGQSIETGTVPPSGPAGWVPGTAVLVRRELLREFEIDEQMSAYFEDNDWSYRVSSARPDPFRRSREALVLHHLAQKRPGISGEGARALAGGQLAALAHFYRKHGLLLGPWLFHLVPELCASDGTRDLASARLLMELVSAKGPEWSTGAWTDGELTGLLTAHQRQTELESALASLRAEIDRLQRMIAEQEETTAFLYGRHQTLIQVEQGGWWRIRRRVLPLIRLLGWLRHPAAPRRGK